MDGMKKGLIVTGGSIDMAFAASFVKEHTYDDIIAADRGVIACEALGLRPDLIVGDFDSAGSDEKKKWMESGIPLRAFNPIKDWTDTEIAMKEAFARGWEEITLLGATGTRLDHVLANVQTMALALEKHIPCMIVDAHNRMHLHTEPFTLEKAKQWGKYVSLFAFGGEVTGLTLTGFYYGTDHMTLPYIGSLGVSNEITAEVAEVTFDKGIILAIESKD